MPTIEDFLRPPVGHKILVDVADLVDQHKEEIIERFISKVCKVYGSRADPLKDRVDKEHIEAMYEFLSNRLDKPLMPYYFCEAVERALYYYLNGCVPENGGTGLWVVLNDCRYHKYDFINEKGQLKDIGVTEALESIRVRPSSDGWRDY